MISTPILDSMEQAIVAQGQLTPEIAAWIDGERERLRPRTPQELRREFDWLRRYPYSENDLARGLDEVHSDRIEGLRYFLLSEHPEVMGDYIEFMGTLKHTSARSDVWCYDIRDERGFYHTFYYEIWHEVLEQGVLKRARMLKPGTAEILMDASYYHIPGGEE